MKNNKHIFLVFSLTVLIIFNQSSLATNIHKLSFQEKETIYLNYPPVAKNDTFYLPAGITNNILKSNILTNDFDPEDDEFIVTFLYAPPTGKIEINCEGEFTFTNTDDFIGTVSFDYIICETENVENSDDATIVIHIINDNDFDGVSNDIDIDDDNDGILDIDEGINIDTDNDGIFNCFDIDSDADGIPDNIESQPENMYISPRWKDSDNDGWDDAYDPDNSGISYTLTDTDNDGTPDFLDSNADDDDLDDVIEGSDENVNLKAVSPLGTDSDNDGLDDAFDIVEGWSNKYNPLGSSVTLPDLNKNGIRDWRENPNDKSIFGEDNPLATGNFRFNIFPNPTIGEFNLEIPDLNSSQPVKIEIINQAGKIVYKNTINNTVTKINPGNLNSGIYFIRIQFGTKLLSNKLIINK